MNALNILADAFGDDIPLLTRMVEQTAYHRGWQRPQRLITEQDEPWNHVADDVIAESLNFSNGGDK